MKFYIVPAVILAAQAVLAQETESPPVTPAPSETTDGQGLSNPAACCTVFNFEPIYTRSPENCPDCHRISWMREVISPQSPVRCIGNNGRRQDACMEFAHNPRLIRQIRCANCQYVADGNYQATSQQ